MCCGESSSDVSIDELSDEVFGANWGRDGEAGDEEDEDSGLAVDGDEEADGAMWNVGMWGPLPWADGGEV